MGQVRFSAEIDASLIRLLYRAGSAISKHKDKMISDECFTKSICFTWQLFDKVICKAQGVNPELANSFVVVFWKNFFTLHLKHLEDCCHTLALATNPWIEVAYRKLAPTYYTYFAQNEAIDILEEG